MRPVDRRLLRHAGAARGYLAVTVVLGMVTTALVLTQAGLLATVLAGAARGRGPALAPALAALVVVVLARAGVAYGGEVAALSAAARVKSQLRRRLATQLLRLGPAWLGAARPGEITTLATRGLDAIDAYFARYLPQLVLAVLVPLAVVARVSAADWISGLLIAVTLPLIPVFAVLVGLHTRARTERQWHLLARLGGHFLDLVEGLPTLKVFGRSRQQAEVIREATGAHRAATMATLRIAFTSALVLELAASLATALVAVEVGLRLLGSHMGYQTALLVLLLTPEAYLPLRAAGAQFHASMEGVTAVGRTCDILEVAGPRRPAPAVPAAADLGRDPVRLERVSLVYPGRDAPALRGVSAVIAPGEWMTVTGPSGSGKSSLLALLLRFAEPASGTIRAAGTDLADIDPDSWRRQVAWVPQRPHLFAGTVGANIRLGLPGAGRAAVERAAALAGAAGFIEDLPRGYGTPLGDGAARLSVGQRQRIALARAFLRDAPLLLLDEPAAHLDPVTAAEIRTAVTALMAGRTVVLVTHDLRPGGTPGRVLRLEGGRPVLAAGCLPGGVPSTPGTAVAGGTPGPQPAVAP